MYLNGLPVRLTVLLATVAMIAVNALANTRGLGGVTTGAMAARYEVSFTPAGFVFAIWGLIYLGLIAFTLLQAFTSSERVAAVRAAYVFTAMANGAWLMFWHYGQLVASQVIMLTLLAALLWIRETLLASPPRSWLERLALDWPMRLYLGWIALVVVWGLFVTRHYRDAIALLVIAWAGSGIALRQGQNPSLVLAGWGLVAAALAAVLALALARLTRGWDIQSAR